MKTEALCNGLRYFQGYFARLICYILIHFSRLHLGIYFDNQKRIDVNDCVSDEFYNLFRSTSNQNTSLYDEVFKCLPSDNILNFDDLATYKDRICLIKTDPVKVNSFSEIFILN